MLRSGSLCFVGEITVAEHGGKQGLFERIRDTCQMTISIYVLQLTREGEQIVTGIVSLVRATVT